jgi:YD repeat-containing protein
MLSVSDTVTNSQQNWSEHRSWSYSYDDFNRLSAANQSDNLAGPAAYSYAYDRFGNRWQQNGPSSMMLTFSGNNNRIDAANGVSYDAAGNVIGYHPPAGDTFSYAYDAENRLASVTDQTTGNKTCYTYDANGRRVERTYNCGTIYAYGRDFLYDLNGHLTSQVEGANVWDRGDVYAGDRMLATYVWDGNVYFNHPDSLGSARLRMTIAGAEHEGCYYLPFGETTCSGDDPSPMHFTGQEEDSFESGRSLIQTVMYLAHLFTAMTSRAIRWCVTLRISNLIRTL